MKPALLRRLIRPSAVLIGVILLCTAAIIGHVEQTITKVKRGLPVETLAQQRAITALDEVLTSIQELIQDVRLGRSEARVDDVRSQVTALRAQLESIRGSEGLRSVLGAAVIYAALNPAAQDLETWLAEGIQGFAPQSDFVLGAAGRRISEAHGEVKEVIAQSSESALHVLQRRAEDLEELRASLVPALLFLTALAIVLVGFVLRERRTEIAAAEAQRRLSDAIDSIPGGFALFDADERLVLCNDRYGDLYPGSRHEVRPGVGLEAMLRAAARAGGIAEAASDPEKWLSERIARFRNPDRPLYIELCDGRWYRIGERRTSDGGTVAISTDVTESRLRERDLSCLSEELKQKNVLLDAALDNMVVGLAMFDGAARLIICNQRYLELYDLPQELGRAGTPLRRIMEVSTGIQGLSPDETRAKVENRVALAGRREDVRKHEFLTNGRVVHIVHRPMAGGGSLATYEDVTVTHNTERALRHAKEEAELANRSKSEFLANMSHELRTPLNAIIGFSEIIKSELFGRIDPRQYHDYASDIFDSGRHLLSLINDILDLSKIEAGKFDLQEQQVDVADAIETSLRLVCERAAAGGVRLDCHIPAGLPTVRADLRALKQILLNLLTNSIKFTRRGGVVTVTADLEEDGGLALTVDDTGVGMSEEDRCKAMVPFGQGDASLTRRHEGTGLGLPLCRRLIELHGGHLVLHSQQGAGTTIIVYFPPARVLHAPALGDRLHAL